MKVLKIGTSAQAQFFYHDIFENRCHRPLIFLTKISVRSKILNKKNIIALHHQVAKKI